MRWSKKVLCHSRILYLEKRILGLGSLGLGAAEFHSSEVDGIFRRRCPLHYENRKLLMPSVPSFQCRQFGNSSDKEYYVSREWLAEIWIEEMRKTKLQRRKIRQRTGTESFQPGHNIFSAFTPHHFPFLNFSREESKSEKIYDQPPISQHDIDSLSPHTPEEVILEPLLSRANLLVARDIEWANIMFAFEQENRYVIIDPCYPQTPVGFIREKSNVIFRQLLRSRRPFTASITDAMGNEIFMVHRPFWLINSTIYAEVNGKQIGVVQRRWHLWRRIYDLYLGTRQFAVVENPGFWNWTFTLMDENENVLAQVDRNWRGMGFELFTDAGQYAIRFGDVGSTSVRPPIEELQVVRSLSLSERAVALALAISLDNDYFSRRGGWGLPFLIATE